MAARDKYHDIVKQALIDDGWTITHDSFKLKHGTKKIEIDLGAEKVIAATKGKEEILIEIKSFISPSPFYEFHAALGQYKNYRRLLRMAKVNRTLFLALPVDAYDVLLDDEFGRLTIEEEDLKIILYEPESKTIEKWIK